MLLQWHKLSRELDLHPFEMQATILRSRRREKGRTSGEQRQIGFSVANHGPYL
jgi:hypothetical protein